MSIEGETEYKAKVRLEARLGEHLNFCPGGLAQNCQHVAGFEPGSCGSETRILSFHVNCEHFSLEFQKFERTEGSYFDNFVRFHENISSCHIAMDDVLR